MSETYTGDGKVAALSPADWLHLAAAPTFAIMALLTGVGGGSPDMLCSMTHDASPLNGMALMYLLMSAFHSAPWLKLVSSWRSGADKSSPAAKIRQLKRRITARFRTRGGNAPAHGR